MTFMKIRGSLEQTRHTAVVQQGDIIIKLLLLLLAVLNGRGSLQKTGQS
jgi:hypothetical protein